MDERTTQMSYKRYIIVLMSLLILWQALSLVMSLPIFPTPYKVIKYTIFHMEHTILLHVIYSLSRIITGIMLAVSIAVPIGILAGYYRHVNHLISPILYFAYPIPKFALLPIIMLVFGIGEWAKIIMVSIIITFPMVVNIRDAMNNINRETFTPYIASGISNSTLIGGVVLKGVLPSLFTTLRIGIGTALSVLFFAENFGTQYGLGFYIMDAWMRINYVAMYSGILLMSTLGLILFLVVDTLNRRLCQWQG